ncbi:unnamed protein product [Orchesella dallaii]|uniref:Uncharacterized protein n=1 Tax=Orchesella dallaii TaxID=48710 RepID=A0ABP1PV37_9HEXA
MDPYRFRVRAVATLDVQLTICGNPSRQRTSRHGSSLQVLAAPEHDLDLFGGMGTAHDSHASHKLRHPMTLNRGRFRESRFGHVIKEPTIESELWIAKGIDTTLVVTPSNL